MQRALKLAREATESSSKPIYTLGPIIHNPQVVESLEEQGVRAVGSLDEVTSGTIIIRTHGVDPKITEAAKAKGLEVVDATCPFVAKAQDKAAKLTLDGHHVIIVGERNHPEVAGLLACAENRAVVIENEQELDTLHKMETVGVVVQTTQSFENLQRIVDGLMHKTKELIVYNTICSATSQRQSAAAELAGSVDVMLVVGGKNSANTTRLAKLCTEKNARTHHIETASEIDAAWLTGVGHIGLTAGASTPDWILQEVVDRLQALGRQA